MSSKFAMVSCLAALAACARAPDAASPLASVPFLYEHGLAYVEIAAGHDRPLLALLDTGANASAIDPDRAIDLPSLGESDVLGTTGSLRVEMVRLTGMSLGAFELPELRATRRPLAGLLGPSGRSVDLILGSDAFVGHALTIDFSSRRLVLSATSPAPVPGAVAMRLDDGIPAIEATLGGVATWLRIDTGASLFASEDVYVNIPSRMWEELRARDPDLAPATHFEGTGADGGVVDLPVARIPATRIGPRSFEHVFVIVQPEAGYFARPDAKGFVSNNYLSRLGRVTLDYGSGRLW